MSGIAIFAESILGIAESVRAGQLDPLEIKLTPEYKKLQKLEAEVGSRLDIDEMLNEVLAAKVSKVQELARVLASPELYVSRLKALSARDLAGMMAYHHPVGIAHLDHSTLERSSIRIKKFIDKLGMEPPEDRIPAITPLPNGYAFPTEEAILLEDAKIFSASIPLGRKVPLDDILLNEDFDEFLRRFLYLVILISKGTLQYDIEDRTIVREAGA
ncbi:MAG: hypothetical protein ACXADC_13320 [Candidatus Thorarchaeota archaeon]|jgi:hypothetical protein